MNEDMIKRNLDFLRELYKKFIINKSKEIRQNYISKYPKYANRKDLVRSYVNRKLFDFEKSDKKVIELYYLIERLNFMSSSIEQNLAMKGVYTNEHFEKISKPVTIEEINSIKVEDFI